MSDKAVEEVALLLESSGYRQLPKPFIVASVEFQFSAVLVSEQRPDLILVVDLAGEDTSRIRKRIESLGRALDLVGSRRPLTGIFVGKTPEPDFLYAVSRVCRALPVGRGDGVEYSSSLRNWLAVLLPLHLPPVTEMRRDPIRELMLHPAFPQGDERVSSELVSAARSGIRAVEHALQELVVSAIRDQHSSDENVPT